MLGLLMGVTCVVGMAPEFAVAAPASSPPVVQDPTLAVTGLVERGRASVNANGILDRTSIVDGKPEANARVVLEFQPSMNNLKAGDAIPSRNVATAVSDSKGAYKLRLTPDREIVATARSNDGWVNFHVVTTARDGSVGWLGLSRHWNGKSWDGLGRPGFAPTDVQQTLVETNPTQAGHFLGPA